MARLSVGRTKKILRELGFPERSNTDQTAHCVLAMADAQPREGLVLGHQTLREGARIHDMTAFPTRQDFKKFTDQLGWGTVVWIADEPEHVVRFNGHIA